MNRLQKEEYPVRILMARKEKYKNITCKIEFYKIVENSNITDRITKNEQTDTCKKKEGYPKKSLKARKEILKIVKGD